MTATNKRVFVGNLPPDASEDDLSKEFSSYGKVKSVEIKTKKDCVNESNVNRFAFINLDIDTWSLNKCIQEFSEQQWKGYYLKVAPAKESFLEQLQRERLEAQAMKKNDVKPQTEEKTETYTTKPLPVKENNQVAKNNVLSKDNDTSSSSEESSESESENEMKDVNKTSLPPPCEKVEETEQMESEDNDFVIKSNKYKGLLHLERLKIPSFGPPISIKADESTDKLLTPKAILAEQKRKQSLLDKKEQYNKQKMQLQKSFLKIDAVPKNKIVFQDNKSAKNKLKNKRENKSTKQNFDTENKVSLFNEDEDDEDNYEFGIKEQFQGHAGQRLLELQSRFSNDKRFALDSRFLEDEAEMEPPNENEDVIEGTIEEERQRQFEILEDVLGKKITKKSIHEHNNPTKSMLRYDPMKPDHSKFLNETRNQNDKNTKKKKNKEVEEILEEKIPVVSKEKFYAVPENLTESMKETKGFSLLNMFGKADSEEVKIGEEVYLEKNIEKRTNKINNPMDIHNNPFHYDSSDSEDDMNGDIRPISEENQSKIGHMSSTGVWRENFFFKENDVRILEGIKFFTNFSASTDSTKDFDNTRREMKQVLKYKVLNNMRKTKMFKKKLGGHKIINKHTKK